MTAKVQRNLGLIGTSAKDANATRSGVADFTSQRLYQKTSTAVDVYGYQGHVAHAGHNSLQVTGTLSLGTAYSDREIYIVIPSMGSNPAYTGNNITGVAIGGVTLTESTHNIYELNAVSTSANSCGISFWRYRDNGALGTSASYTIDFGSSGSSYGVHTGVIAFTTGNTKAANDDTYGVSSNSNWGSSSNVFPSSGGFVLYAAIGQNTPAPSGTYVTGYTNGIAFDAGSTEYVVVCHKTIPVGTITSVPQPNYTTSGNSAFAAVARGP